eukprot:Hpha_TRINITY_DN16782_c4_g1::TRINITY_DN16782_c4_g1_i1::g.76910::m.76910/K01661/menB; naphthoate synthase
MKLRDLQDVLYSVENGLCWITINRPKRYNSFTALTIAELIFCLKQAWRDPAVGVVALTGAGDKAFCTGGDQKQKQLTGDYGEADTENGLFEVQSLHHVIREIPKPVIAAVNGFAIGGGHVLHVICDITIAADTAKFGQTGPKVGSFDAGFGTAYLARIIGEKRAREVWFLCRQYDAHTMRDWGLVNQVVKPAELKAEVRKWADGILQLSPTALKVLKHSFNADSDNIGGIQKMAFASLDLFTSSPESQEGVAAFNEKRKPDFARYRGQPHAPAKPPPKTPPALPELDVRGKVAVVTGAASGIGRAIAERCLSAGMRVALIDLGSEALRRTQAALQAEAPGRVIAAAADVSKPEDMHAAARATDDAFGGDVCMLFNNAAVSGLSHTSLTTASDLALHRATMEVNLWGIIHGARAFLPAMQRAQGGAFLVNTASVAGLATADDFYAVTKHAVVAVSEVLQRELKAPPNKPGQVHVAVLCPSYTKTNFYQNAAAFAGVDAGAEQTDSSKPFTAGRPHPKMLNQVGKSPAEVADIVFDGLRRRAFFINTHPDWSEAVANDRADSIVRGMPNAFRSTKKVFATYKSRL